LVYPFCRIAAGTDKTAILATPPHTTYRISQKAGGVRRIAPLFHLLRSISRVCYAGLEVVEEVAHEQKVVMRFSLNDPFRSSILSECQQYQPAHSALYLSGVAFKSYAGAVLLPPYSPVPSQRSPGLFRAVLRTAFCAFALRKASHLLRVASPILFFAAALNLRLGFRLASPVRPAAFGSSPPCLLCC